MRSFIVVGFNDRWITPMDYADFSVEDLAADERFITWVKNDCSESENEFWRLLVLSHPDLQEKMDRARILVINVHRAEDRIDPVDPVKVHEIWQNVLVGIEDEDEDTPGTNEAPMEIHSDQTDKVLLPQRRRHTLAYAVAACVALLVFAFFLAKQEAEPSLSWYSYTQDTPEFLEYINTGQKPLQLVMMDGSVISLEANSRVKYKEDYSADTIRKVYLQGEAFFEVARDPQKPFLVFTNDVATEVLGTSFRVIGDATTNNVVVKVKTGKVSVYSIKKQSATLSDPKDGVILLPNQEVTYTDEEDMFEKKIVDTPELLQVPPDDSFVFENTPIATVFSRLEESYGVEILFDRETMQNCFLTVPLGSEPLFKKLEVICRTIGASYEVLDAKVVITSAGCKTANAGNLNE